MNHEKTRALNFLTQTKLVMASTKSGRYVPPPESDSDKKLFEKLCKMIKEGIDQLLNHPNLSYTQVEKRSQEIKIMRSKAYALNKLYRLKRTVP